MGGCASVPKDLNTADEAPAPVEAPPATDKVEAETAAQETGDGDETKDKPVVVEAPEPAPESEKTEEVKAEAEPAVQDDEPKEAKAEVNLAGIDIFLPKPQTITFQHLQSLSEYIR